ncbi:MAG: DUF2975 domain-containing protein [bacterium]|nr:DUF2975 domain-containing protein [bacterium]
MEDQEKIIKKIQTCLTWAALFNVIGIFVAMIMAADNRVAISYVFEGVVLFYILMQIHYCCQKLMTTPIFSRAITGYMRKVSYACFVSSIGSSIIQTIVGIMEQEKFTLTLDLTMIGIGLLIYVGAYIYEYGCQMKHEIDLTI